MGTYTTDDSFWPYWRYSRTADTVNKTWSGSETCVVTTTSKTYPRFDDLLWIGTNRNINQSDVKPLRGTYNIIVFFLVNLFKYWNVFMDVLNNLFLKNNSNTKELLWISYGPQNSWVGCRGFGVHFSCQSNYILIIIALHIISTRLRFIVPFYMLYTCAWKMFNDVRPFFFWRYKLCTHMYFVTFTF